MSNFDSIQYRKQIWEDEYNSKKNLPSSKTHLPSRAVKTFINEFNPKDKSFVLDLGSGNGRNAIFLVNECGFKKALGLELSNEAVRQANEKIKGFNLTEKIQFSAQNIGDGIDLKDEACSLIIDMMVMHSLLKEDREFMVKEVVRLLKQGGYFVFYTIAAESEAAKDLVNKNPGPEENSYRFSHGDYIFTEKAFTKEELSIMFHPLKLIKIEPKEEYTPAFRDLYKRLYYYGVFQKV